MRIAVIGAGPSGSRAAANLARAGHEVTLFDRTFDREKPCGGGIPWRGLARLPSEITDSLFDPSGDGEAPRGGPETVRGVAVRRVVFEAPSGRRAEVELPKPVAVYSRRELDRALVRAARSAGARLVERGVVGLDRVDDRWSVTFSPEGSSSNASATSMQGAGSRAGASRAGTAPGIEPAPSGSSNVGHARDAGADPNGPPGGLYDHVVGADGARSFVRRAVGEAPFAGRDLSQAVGWYVPAPASDTMTIRFDARIAGYLWAFPRADHLAIGACAALSAGSAERLWAAARELLDATRPGTLGGTDRPYSALIPSLGPDALAASRVCGPGWSLVGDAAGLVDPLTREGIAPGLRSSDLLAEAFGRGDPGSYGALVRETLHPEMAWAAARRERFFEPVLLERLVRYLERSRAVRSVMVDLILGEQDYGTLKRRLVRSALPAGLQIALAALVPARRRGAAADSRALAPTVRWGTFGRLAARPLEIPRSSAPSNKPSLPGPVVSAHTPVSTRDPE